MADIYTYSTPLAELFKEYESAAVPEPSGMVSRPASQKEESTEDAYSPLGFLPNFGATVRSFFTEEEAKEVDALPRVADVRTSAIDEVLTDMDMLAYESAMEASAIREEMGVTGLPGSRAPISSLRPPERVGLLASGPVLNSIRPQARPEPEDFEIDTTAIEAVVAAAIGGNADRGEPTPVATEEEPPTRVRQGLGLMSPSAEADPEIDTTPAATEGEGSMSPSVESLEGPEAAFSSSVLNLRNQTETVSRGAKGNSVLNAQLRLAELGYDIGRGGKTGLKKNKLGKWSSLDNSQLRGVDSSFGPSTESAVKAFQKDAGLPVTGSIDEATAQAMSEKPAVKFNVPESYVKGLSEKKKTYFNAAKDAATRAGLSGAELASYMAQTAHESDGFNTTKEYASGAAYEGRTDLGNTQPGDGKRYKGRGYIQLTGRSNYEKAGKALGLDLVGNPSLAEDPKIAGDVSVWFWKTQVRPQVPDFLDTERVTKVVNGGFNGLSDRKSYLEKFTKKWNED